MEVEIPPTKINDENVTYVQGRQRHLYKVDIDEMKDVSAANFSVENDIIFELFTPTNPTEPQILSLL